jgi:hypothetical protein
VAVPDQRRTAPQELRAAPLRGTQLGNSLSLKYRADKLEASKF